MREIDRVLDDVDFRVEIGGDIDRRVGDDQRVRVAGHVHDEAMADAALGADPALPRNDRAHQLIRMKAAFHERFRSTGAHLFDSLGGGRMAVFRVDELHAGKVETDLVRNAADALDRTDQDRIDQAEAHRLGCSAHGRLVARVRDSHLDRWHAFGRRQ